MRRAEEDKRLLNEIEHGKYLIEHGAGETWNWESPAGKLRWERRVAMLKDKLEKDSKVLELGCGTGYFTRELVDTDAHITAIDISPDLLEEARKEVSASNVEFNVDNAYAMRFHAGTFDHVVGSSVLHHLEIREALSEMYRVLKPGGQIAFTEPNMMNPQIALQKNIPFIKRKMGDSPDETAFFSWQMRRLLQEAGFTSIRVLPFDFLHPAVPPAMIKTISLIGNVAEKTPLLRGIAGSLFITARK
ncbi:MAG: methyltransferase domain-containing protein [Bacteroidales bacterium]|nr:methyltransferase domain-containing protein [Bacteroidales bacterium]